MKKVVIISSPITERYVKSGDTGFIDGNKIRVGDAWFDFDDRWQVKEA